MKPFIRNRWITLIVWLLVHLGTNKMIPDDHLCARWTIIYTNTSTLSWKRRCGYDPQFANTLTTNLSSIEVSTPTIHASIQNTSQRSPTFPKAHHIFHTDLPSNFASHSKETAPEATMVRQLERATSENLLTAVRAKTTPPRPHQLPQPTLGRTAPSTRSWHRRNPNTWSPWRSTGWNPPALTGGNQRDRTGTVSLPDSTPNSGLPNDGRAQYFVRSVDWRCLFLKLSLWLNGNGWWRERRRERGRVRWEVCECWGDGENFEERWKEGDGGLNCWNSKESFYKQGRFLVWVSTGVLCGPIGEMLWH